MYDDYSCMIKVQKEFVIVLTATIVMWISAVTTVISQAADAQQDQENQSSSDNCASDQNPCTYKWNNTMYATRTMLLRTS